MVISFMSQNSWYADNFQTETEPGNKTLVSSIDINEASILVNQGIRMWCACSMGTNSVKIACFHWCSSCHRIL